MTNPTNNEEWWKKRFTVEPTKIEDLDLDSLETLQAEDDGYSLLTIRRDEAECFLAAQIQAAEKRGKREGLEEAKKIIIKEMKNALVSGNLDDWHPTFKIDQAINKLKQ